MYTRSFSLLFALSFCWILSIQVAFGNNSGDKCPESPAKLLTLNPPAYLNVTQVGTTWAHLVWPFVPGADHYHIITRESISGTIVSNLTYVVYSPNGVNINGLSPGVTYYSTIYSVDSNNVESASGTNSNNYDTIIIELVASAFTIPQGGFNSWGPTCTVTENSNQACRYSWSSGVSTYFTITKQSEMAKQIKFLLNIYGAITQLKPDDTNTDNYGIGKYLFANGSGADYGKYVDAFYNGVQIARLTVGSPTAADPNGRIFRDNIGANDPSGFPIQKIEPRQMGASSPSQDNSRSEIDNSWNTGLRSFQVSPNPFSQQLEIQIPFTNTPVENDIIVNLYDSRGQIVLTQQFPGRTPMINVATNDLPTGIYFLRVDTGERSETIKVLKTQ